MLLEQQHLAKCACIGACFCLVIGVYIIVACCNKKECFTKEIGYDLL